MTGPPSQPGAAVPSLSSLSFHLPFWVLSPVLESMREEKNPAPALWKRRILQDRSPSKQWHVMTLSRHRATALELLALSLLCTDPLRHPHPSPLSSLHTPGLHLPSSLRLEGPSSSSSGEGLLGGPSSTVRPQRFHFFH